MMIMSKRRNTLAVIRQIESRIATGIREARQAAGLPHYHQPRRDQVADDEDEQRPK